MRQHLADVTPRTIILTPDGRVGFYAYRYVADDGRAVGQVLIQEQPGETTAVDVDVEAVVDVVYCDRQAQEALWKRMVGAADGSGSLAPAGGRYTLADGGAAWIDAGRITLRVERDAGGVRVGAFERTTADTAALPLRALHFLPGEV